MHQEPLLVVVTCYSSLSRAVRQDQGVRAHVSLIWPPQSSSTYLCISDMSGMASVSLSTISVLPGDLKYCNCIEIDLCILLLGLLKTNELNFFPLQKVVLAIWQPKWEC
ncbi:hypothetical protein Cni_G17534 [Canna indica]|uniref:Uncharacterized protein n=1 Tax=Canna indica TaxID=4628 RepID=A0AAQ3QDM7_9LILI|nr:hypothetical protein Cni_G17534 [Canna indica]